MVTIGESGPRAETCTYGGRCYGEKFLCIMLDLLKMDGATDISPCSLRAQLGEKHAAHRDMDASNILEDILRYICHCDVSSK